MALHFEKHAAKGNEFINRLALHLKDVENRDRAGRVLRCVLKVLRDRITLEESFQLIAQLPMAIKAVYVDGWIPQRQHVRIKTMQEFAEQVVREDGLLAWRDFSTLEDALLACEAVVKTIADYVTAGELHQVIAVLPEDMKGFFLKWSHTP